MNYNTKKSFLYQMRDDSKSIIMFYSILIVVYVLVFVTTGVTISNNGNGYFQSNGFGMATAIFLFCACAFKESFHMLMQNGVSRKSVYFGRILKSVTLSLILAMVDLIIKNLFGIFASLIGENFLFDSLFDMLYNGYCSENNTVIVFLTSFLFFFVLFLFFHMLGYLMSTVFYRLSKTAKAFFAAGIPIFMFVIYPVIDVSFFDGQITINLLNWLTKIFGIATQNPFIGVLSLLIGAGLLTVLSWLPIRHARVE